MGRVTRVSEPQKPHLDKNHKDKKTSGYAQKKSKKRSFNEHLEEEKEKYEKPAEQKSNKTKPTITELANRANSNSKIIIRSVELKEQEKPKREQEETER